MLNLVIRAKFQPTADIEAPSKWANYRGLLHSRGHLFWMLRNFVFHGFAPPFEDIIWRCVELVEPRWSLSSYLQVIRCSPDLEANRMCLERVLLHSVTHPPQ